MAFKYTKRSLPLFSLNLSREGDERERESYKHVRYHGRLAGPETANTCCAPQPCRVLCRRTWQCQRTNNGSNNGDSDYDNASDNNNNIKQ